MQVNDYDKACRSQAKWEPAAMLAYLLALAHEDFNFVRWLDARRVVFPGQPDRTCDTVAHIENLAENHLPWAIVIEFMIDPEALMFGRMLGYLALLWIEEKPSSERGDRFELGAVVVNLRGKGNASRHHVWLKAGMETHLRVREVNLSTLSAADTLEQIAHGKHPRAVLPWIPLMQGGHESSIIQRWKEVASAEPLAHRRGDYGALALVFAGAAGCNEAWKLALKEWNMIESEVVKEWKDQALREGRVADLIDILRDKFGNLPTEIPSHLQKIDDFNVLHQLLLKAVHASDLDEFRRMIPNGTK
jgi:hypothetical protein